MSRICAGLASSLVSESGLWVLRFSFSGLQSRLGNLSGLIMLRTIREMISQPPQRHGLYVRRMRNQEVGHKFLQLIHSEPEALGQQGKPKHFLGQLLLHVLGPVLHPQHCWARIHHGLGPYLSRGLPTSARFPCLEALFLALLGPGLLSCTSCMNPQLTQRQSGGPGVPPPNPGGGSSAAVCQTAEAWLFCWGPFVQG